MGSSAFIAALALLTLVNGWLWPSPAGAAVPTCCFCEIGDQPARQQPFFRAGCAVWLRKQKGCLVKATVAQNTDYASVPLVCRGGHLKIGFVGHWSSARETIEILRHRAVPAMSAHALSVSFDNTACSGMNRPEDVREYVQSLALPGDGSRFLEVRGHQVDSVGEWEAVLGKSVSFRAVVSSRLSDVDYPSCGGIEGRPCVPALQTGQTGSCRRQDGGLERLTCCVPRWPGVTVLNPLIHQSWNARQRCLY